MLKDIILVLVLQLVYVPAFTLRTIFLVKGLRMKAALLGLIESLIYIFGLAIVFNGEQNMVVMIVYALGFGIGIIIGSLIEERLAIGYTTIQVVLSHRNKQLVDQLRIEGYGVTVYEGEGKDALRYKLEVLTKRNQEEGLFEMIRDYEPAAFIIAYEPKTFKGGFLLKDMKRRKKKKAQGND
ncbi:DUF5698 domain-containing protein [Neobacillus sp. D3-1R]|uniref:DUF5698 domain-containing protein n=1 Tax=Neobacillus sp. D3-1R TaxID=3445778 RepID=UPI003F9F43D3